MRTALALVLCSSLALGAEPKDVPREVVLTPEQARANDVERTALKLQLHDCEERGNVSPTWLVVGIAAGVIAGALAGYGLAQVKR